MKKILLLLLFTIASYGQAVFDEGIQITNTESTTATKVNVQEANGKVNTKTINTAFNKNFGLNTGDVVGANTLLNQYSATPVDWTTTTFASGQVVFYGGKQWIAKIATAAGDVPAVSPKWEEITFEALANKTTTVDQTIIDGSTNAVSGNAVFDALATKAPISSVHNPVTLGTANGLSLATQQLSLGLASSGVTGALSGTDWNTFNGKFNTPTGLTTNYLPKWNGSGFGNSQIIDNGTNVGIGTTNVTDKLTVGGTISMYGASKVVGDGGFYINGSGGVNGDGGAIFLNNGVGSKTWKISTGIKFNFQDGFSIGNNTLLSALCIKDNGNVLIGTILDNGVDQVQVAGTISASPATTGNQVVVKSQLDAVVGTSGTFTVTGIQNATYMLVGKILTIYLSASFTGVSGGFIQGSTFTLPNGYISADFLAGRFVGNGSSFNGTSTPLTAWAEEMSNTSLRYNISGTGAVNHKSFITISLRIQ